MKKRTIKKKIALSILPALIQVILFFSFLINRRKVDLKNIKKILIPSYTGLGNFILKTPMIKALHKAYPKAQIIVLAGGCYGAEIVLKESNLVSNITTFKLDSSLFEKIKFAFKLRKEKYDLIFLPFDASPPFLRIFSLFAGIPIRIGHHYKELYGTDPWIKLYTHPVALKAGRHEIDLNLDLLVPLGIKNVKNKDTFFHLGEDVDIKHLLPWGPNSTRYWCVQLSAANAIKSVKRWKSVKFAKTLDILIEKYKFPVVALGDKNERENYQRVQKLMKNDLIDCVGKTKVKEVAMIIKKGMLLLCHDSGLMHISVALKIPVVALYGPTDYTRTAPIGPQHKIIRKNIDCSPCMYADAKSEKEVAATCIHLKCIKSIEVDQVVDAVSSILDKD